MRLKLSITEITGILFVCVVIFLIGAAVVGMVVNETHSVPAGYIVDKQYTQAYFIDDVYHSAAYRFTVAGEKNGRSVQYTFSVTEDEYDRYKIGDWYKR